MQTYIQTLKTDDLYVNLLVKNGPAHLSGHIQQGDLLKSINQGVEDHASDSHGTIHTYIRWQTLLHPCTYIHAYSTTPRIRNRVNRNHLEILDFL